MDGESVVSPILSETEMEKEKHDKEKGYLIANTISTFPSGCKLHVIKDGGIYLGTTEDGKKTDNEAWEVIY